MIEVDLTEDTPTIGCDTDQWVVRLLTGTTTGQDEGCWLQLDGCRDKPIRHKGRAPLCGTGIVPYTMFDRDITESGRYEILCQVRHGPSRRVVLDILLSPEKVAITVLKTSTPATWIMRDEIVSLKGTQDYTLTLYEEAVERPAAWDRIGSDDESV